MTLIEATFPIPGGVSKARTEPARKQDGIKSPKGAARR